MVIGVSTRTASRSPEIRVDEIGGHGRCFSPGGRSLVMAGMLGARNTSHFSDTSLVVRPDLELLLSDCPFTKRAWPAPIGHGVAVTTAMLRAFDRNSRLEGMMAFSARMFAPFLKQQPAGMIHPGNPHGATVPSFQTEGASQDCPTDQTSHPCRVISTS